MFCPAALFYKDDFKHTPQNFFYLLTLFIPVGLCLFCGIPVDDTSPLNCFVTNLAGYFDSLSIWKTCLCLSFTLLAYLRSSFNISTHFFSS